MLTRAQAKDHWQRVYTGEGTVIEINTSTVRFETGQVLRADFRTIFSKAESVGGDAGAKYKTRLETIDFRVRDRRYRFFEIALLDASGKSILKKTTDTSEEWRIPKPGGITERLYDAACGATPLGAFKVVGYRFAETDPKGVKSTPELDRLIGVGVHLHLDRAEVGGKVCTAPVFQTEHFTKEELSRKLGIELKTIVIKGDDVETINVKCETGGWEPPGSLLIKGDREEMLMLWEGVFLVLKRSSATEFHGGTQTLKRSLPKP